MNRCSPTERRLYIRKIDFINYFLGEYKLTTPKGFLNVDGEVKLDSPDDFTINFNADSDKFKYRNIKAEIANKPTPQEGRKIFITITSEGKNLITGKYEKSIVQI